jgi:hypothetical protein
VADDFDGDAAAGGFHWCPSLNNRLSSVNHSGKAAYISTWGFSLHTTKRNLQISEENPKLDLSLFERELRSQNYLPELLFHFDCDFVDVAEFGFPVALEHDPVDVALAGVGQPDQGFRGFYLAEKRTHTGK